MPHHVVVDGSNIATEGRSQPSLKQLNEAVMAFIQERPDALITVVVDATFGHRIDPKESDEFDDAVANNELVAPPAGAIGRGDAFVLSIANKVNAVILTNDSYQEFHGQYEWLFEEGRLIGGKPVPHIGWVFVPRLPVRGPLSRKVTAEAKRRGGRGRNADAPAADPGTVRVGSPEASKPMPVPKTPPPRAAAAPAPAVTAAAAPVASTGKRGDLNEVMPFLTFVERHPAGTSVNAIVDHYSSHGAYVKVGDIMGYVPLRLMADPAPRSAREFVKLGEAITLVVEKFVPEKRSVDLAVPGMGSAPMVEAKPAKATRARKATKKAADAEPVVEVVEAVVETAPAKPRRGTKKAASAVAPVVVEVAPPAPQEEPPKKPSRRTAKKAAPPVEAAPQPVATVDVQVKDVQVKDVPVKKAAAKKSAAKKAPAKKAVAAKAAAPKKAVAKKSAG
jgi:hypothetical protein